MEASSFVWKDIDSAPKDGRHVLLFRPEIMFVGYWASGNCGWIISAPGLPHMQPEPTHWMELPKEPNKSFDSNMCGRKTCHDIGTKPCDSTCIDFQDIANSFDDILETGYQGDGI